VVFVPYDLRDVATVYPASFTPLDDVMLAAPPVASSTISGVDRDPAQLPAALAGRQTVWLVSGDFGSFTTARPEDRRKLDLLSARFRTVERFQLTDLSVARLEAVQGVQGSEQLSLPLVGNTRPAAAG
jgi:hypothetical protein